jgi:hypothetical protein
MNRGTLRTIIAILTVITAVIHLFLGSRDLSSGFGVLFILNGVGYLVLLYALLRPFSFLEGQRTLVHYAFMAFTAVTILAWLFLNGDFSNPIGLITKIDEVLLVAALWMHLRAEQQMPAPGV